MSKSIESLVQSATALASAGRWAEAEQQWREVHRLDPANAAALTSLGTHAWQRGAHTEARRWLSSAIAAEPRNLLAQLTLALACRALGDAAAEREAIDAALVIDPYCLPAMLGRGDWLDRAGQRQAAAASYGYALQMASPDPARWPAPFKGHLERAEAYVRAQQLALHAHLQSQLDVLRDALPAGRRAQWLEAQSLFAGTSRPYHSQCNQLHVPRLPAIPFFERAAFPWLSELEAATGVIRQELDALLASGQQGFSPYIAYRPGEPVNQWQALNHSPRWNAFHLWRNGEPVAEHLARCPATGALIERLQLVRLAGLCPNVMFSALAPGTHIPPHHGETNARLVAHLPLVVPPDCWLRVGHERRGWTTGETLIFDDTIEHEAMNASAELRVVLIFDVWNPLLSEPERAMVQAMTAARRTFGQG